MEIAEYLRIIKKRIWVVVLIPVLAVALAIPLVLRGPTEYAATATVAGPLVVSRAPGSPYKTTNGARQFVADFAAAATLPAVIDATAQMTNTPPDQIGSKSSATPIGQSSLVQVRYQSADASNAAAVAKALAFQTLEYLLRPSAEARVARQPSAYSDLPIQRLDLLLQQPETITVDPATKVSRQPELIRAVGLAVATGVVLALVVVILLEVIPLRRRHGRKHEPDESAKVLEETAV